MKKTGECYQGAKLNGLKIGFYHYLTNKSPSLEAQHFLNSINGLVSDCKYIIDVEGTWTIAQASKATREFADYLISKNKEAFHRRIINRSSFPRHTLDEVFIFKFILKHNIIIEGSLVRMDNSTFW